MHGIRMVIMYPNAFMCIIVISSCMYAGVDWRDQANWHCNARHPPGGEFEYDGVTTHPLEVMFVPVGKLNLYAGHPAARAAKRYDIWQEAQVRAQAPEV